MKVLSVRQPWASLIIEFGKNAENREWQRLPKYNGPLAIHASKLPDRDSDGIRYFVERALNKKNLREFKLRWSCNELPLGAIIGLVDWNESYGLEEWCPSPWAINIVGVRQLMLRYPQKLDIPIPAKGRLGLWDPAQEAWGPLQLLMKKWPERVREKIRDSSLRSE